MKSLRPVRENVFGWWLADLEDRQPWSPRVRPVGQPSLDFSRVDELRNKQLISRTSVPSREELLQLIQSGRLPHLGRHQGVIERVLGPKAKDEEPVKEDSDSTSTPSTPSPVQIGGDLQVLEDAVRDGFVDEDLARQVSRLRDLSANLAELRLSSSELHRDLKTLDRAVTRILSSARSLRRDAEDLCFLEKLLAAAEGQLSIAPSCNLIV